MHCSVGRFAQKCGWEVSSKSSVSRDPAMSVVKSSPGTQSKVMLRLYSQRHVSTTSAFYTDYYSLLTSFVYLLPGFFLYVLWKCQLWAGKMFAWVMTRKYRTQRRESYILRQYLGAASVNVSYISHSLFQVLIGLQPFVNMHYVLTSVGIRRNEKGIVSWSIVFFVVV